MKTINQYISDLLLIRECVIIPGFGGFVLNDRPATIDSLQHKLIPPGKQISFNSHLVNNDGLLADKVAQEEGMSYDEAMEKIDVFVRSIKDTLNDHLPFQIDKVGALFTDENGKVLFEPNRDVNYSLESFGLSAFHAIPVQRERVIEEVEEVIQKKIAPVEKVEPVRQPIEVSRKGIKLKHIAYSAAILPIVAYMAWLPTSTDIFKSGYKFQSSDLNPFTDKVCEIYKEREVTEFKKETTEKALIIEDINNVKGAYANVSLLGKDDEGFNPEDHFTVKLIGEKKIVVENSEKALAKMPVKVNTSGYKIIAGCFGVKENAQAYIGQLKAKGYPAFLVDFHKGLYRVSAGAYSSRKEASGALSKFQSSENNSAWLLR